MALGAWGARSAAAATKLAGVQAHLLWQNVDDAEMKRQLDLVKASGANIARVDVGWASIQETGPGSLNAYHTGRLDAVIAAANARGIKLLLTFMTTPCWASTAPETLKQGCTGEWWSRGVGAYAPRDPADYAAALKQLAARYKGKVTAWEIWNEPNHPEFWKAPDQAAAYAALVKAAYPAVKAADPSAIVVAGALSQSDHAFTQRLYDLGIKGYFDAFSIHPYSDDFSPLDPRTGQDARYSFVRGVPAVHDVMVANGDSRPLWLTESGFSTSPTRTSQSWRNGVSEATQARYLKEQLEQVAKWPYVAATIWFKLKDTSSDPADLFGNCGLRRWDGTAKPAWAAFQDGVAYLSNSEGQPEEGPSQPPEGPSQPAPTPTSTPTPAPPPVSTPPAPVAPAPVAPAPAPVAPAPVAPAPAPVSKRPVKPRRHRTRTASTRKARIATLKRKARARKARAARARHRAHGRRARAKRHARAAARRKARAARRR